MKLLLTMLALVSSSSAFAMTGAECIEIDQNGIEQEDGFRIHVRGYENQPDRVKSASMSDPGHSDIKLKPSYYEFSMPGDGSDHVTFASNMTVIRRDTLARVVVLNVKWVEDLNLKRGGKWLGDTKITYVDLKTAIAEAPEVYNVQCDVK